MGINVKKKNINIIQVIIYVELNTFEQFLYNNLVMKLQNFKSIQFSLCDTARHNVTKNSHNTVKICYCDAVVEAGKATITVTLLSIRQLNVMF